MTTDFSSLLLSPSLLTVIAELGYTEPTPIQASSIPALLAGKDLIGQSKTGSGKTVAFALPILQGVDLERRSLQALVVCPTRELSAQVARELRKHGRRHKGLQVLIVAGGEPLRPQADALERGVHVAVGTPGRLLDHLQRRTMDPCRVATVVLDEADRMLEMGFLPDMEKILRALPRRRQTALFSATFPAKIEALSREHQRGAVRVSVDDPAQVLPEIRQLSLAAEPDQKLHALYWALEHHPHESALIFCNLKATAAELAGTLAAGGMSVDCLSGGLEQFHRDQVLATFRNESVRVLIATDVAARGIDVLNLDLVVNYELPRQPEIYVHRIGRTGRAGKPGLSIALASSRERRRLGDFEQLTGVRIERLPRVAGGEAEVATLARALAREARMQTILISGGRKDKVRPGDIMGALTGDAGGLSAADVGKIELHDRLSYVAVSRRVAKRAAKGLNAGRIKGRRFRATLVQRDRP